MSEPTFFQKLFLENIKVDGNCKITYKRAGKDSKPSKLLFNNGKLTNFENIDLITLTDKNISIFKNIGILDGDSESVSLKDLSLLRKYFGNEKYKFIFEKLGITSVRFDANAGIENIEINGAKLSIDFETEVEQIQKNYPDIKADWIPYIVDISERTNYSADLIAMILSSESFTPTAVHKDENGGLCEVGFGHTTQANHNNNFKKGFKIDLKTAFEWFEQDLKDKEEKIKGFGDAYNYDKLPRSIQEAMLDVAFNRGEGKLNPKSKCFDTKYIDLQNSIKKKNYAEAAVLIRQAEEKMAKNYRNGLRKRNVNRFFLAIRDLTKNEQIKAKKLFNKNGYYDRTIEGLNPKNQKIIKSKWKSII